MFYCEECRKARKWPDSILFSLGNCELCGRMSRCYDRPSSSLPGKPPTVTVALGLTIGRDLQEKLRAHDASVGGIDRNLLALPETYREAILFLMSTEFDEVLELAERKA